MVTQEAKHPKALVIAGNKDILQLVTAILKHDNFTFASAMCHTEGFALAKSDTPEVIIVLADNADTVDEFCKQVRDDHQIADIPLVVLTTSGNSETYKRFFANGCDQVLPVPFKCSQFF